LSVGGGIGKANRGERSFAVALGDRAYRIRVSPEAQAFAKEHPELGRANWFVPSGEAPPYYPPTVREMFRKVAELGADDDE
jgi:hypothetical protein